MEKKENKNFFSLGQKNPEKIKKEINFEVQPKHILMFIVFLFVWVALIIKVLFLLGFGELEQVGCSDGSYEEIEFQKEIYCGEHYTNLKGKVKEDTFINMQNIILYNITK